MQSTPRTTVGTVYLDADPEQRFCAHVLRAGGRVVDRDDTTTAEAVAGALALVSRTLAVLEQIAEAELPPVIQDVVPRARTA